jgi:hypothetical protein
MGHLLHEAAVLQCGIRAPIAQTFLRIGPPYASAPAPLIGLASMIVSRFIHQTPQDPVGHHGVSGALTICDALQLRPGLATATVPARTKRRAGADVAWRRERTGR